ncbi:MAG: hypothetical protein IPK65_06635 [Gammaproteobacteria bacterium]|nr:hypothetical protein [Gammaproteobacteria bacterium]
MPQALHGTPEITEDASEAELVDMKRTSSEDAEAEEAIDSREEPEQTSWALVITVVILLNALLGGGMFWSTGSSSGTARNPSQRKKRRITTGPRRLPTRRARWRPPSMTPSRL